MNINQLMKQTEAMQKKMMQMQEEFASKEFEGKAGGGVVTVVLNGKSEALRVKIDPSIINKDDKEILEDLMIAAFNDAKKKVEENSESNMMGMFNNMGLPSNFKFPF